MNENRSGTVANATSESIKCIVTAVILNLDISLQMSVASFSPLACSLAFYLRNEERIVRGRGERRDEAGCRRDNCSVVGYFFHNY